MLRRLVAPTLRGATWTTCAVRHFEVDLGGPDPAPRPKDGAAAAKASVATTEYPTVVDTDGALVQDNSEEARRAEYALTAMQAEVQREHDALEVPTHPDDLVTSAYTRVKRDAKLVRYEDIEVAVVDRKQAWVGFGPAPEHPWVEGQPIGTHIIHGDGQQALVGSGEVGFEPGTELRALPVGRGFEHRSTVGRQVPQHNGYVNEDLVTKHSLALTGRGLFATADIKEGDLLMVVRSSSTALGFNALTDRLIEMVTEVLLKAHRGTDEDRTMLHDWVLTGQQSSRVEWWSDADTARVLKRIGPDVLEELELHPLHVARLAAILEMNSFQVEGFYNEDKGRGYWPEAGLLNHSCCANADYDVMSMDEFIVSDYHPAKIAQKQEEKRRKHVHPVNKAVHAEMNGGPQERPKMTFEGMENVDDVAPDVSRLLRAFAKGQRGAVDEELGRYKKYVSTLDADVRTLPGEQPQAQPQHQHRGAKVAVDEAPRDDAMVHVGDAEPEPDEDGPSTLFGFRRNEFVFCCRANRDIPAGEEVLIAYVPPEWRYEYRQQVLHDRYRFWCRCAKCAPVIEGKSKLMPRFMMAVILFSGCLQLIVYRARKDTFLHMQDTEDGVPCSNTRRYSS